MDNYFKVFALGENFDVDAFVAASSLVPTTVWRRGEPKGGRGSPYPSSGVVYDIGDGNSVPFLQQEDIAIEFLQKHRDELKALSQFPGVTHLTLGLHYTKRAERNLVGFSLSASQLLMWHLLDIGCHLTNYIWLEYPEPDDLT
jgi:hypothetical protein